ncbi:MAG: hypothetical protein Kow00133_17810 [Amphiplicatus sp.]
MSGASKGNGGEGNGASGVLTADRKQTATGRKPTVSHVLGEIVWLYSQSPTHKHFTIGDLEWMVMPAILLEQFRIFHGEKAPVGVAVWAWLSEEAERRLKDAVAAGRGARLKPDEWKSGDRLWVLDLVAPLATPDNKLVEAMLADLAQNVFPGRTIRLHATDPATGKREMKEIGG